MVYFVCVFVLFQITQLLRKVNASVRTEEEPFIVATVSVSNPSLYTRDPLILPCTVLHANNRWLSLQWSVYLHRNHYEISCCMHGSRQQHEIVTKESVKTRTLRSYQKPLANMDQLAPNHTKGLHYSWECLLATQLVLRFIGKDDSFTLLCEKQYWFCLWWKLR